MRKIAGLVLILISLFLIPVQAEALTVAVSPDSTVVGPQLTLGEIATITGPDEARVQALRATKLGSAPPPGRRLEFTPESLGVRLSSSGADFTGVTWQVPALVVVQTAAQLISGELIATRAEEEASRRLTGDGNGAEVIVSLQSMPNDIPVPLGKVETRVEFPGGLRLNYPIAASVNILVDGRPAAAVPVKLTVDVYRNVVVAARNIAFGEQITQDCLRVERQEIGHLKGFVTDPAKLVGLVARRAMVAGLPIAEAEVIKPVLIQRGGTVIILAQVGEMVITASGKALQEGREGEVIRVQNNTSRKTFNARVIDGTTVQVITYSGR